jgi:phosphatidylserine/phosphatidylglycerophosphate/cardiolipin synthase-like enzyme
VGGDIPFCSVDITGIASQFSFTGFGGYQLLARGTDDFSATSSICLISSLVQSDISTTGFTISWQTDTNGDTKLEYGTTTGLGEVVEIDEDVTDHAVVLDNLEPGTVYYVRASSSNDDSTAESLVVAFVTLSNSSGEITVYFTSSVDTSVADDEDAIGLFTETNDTIAAYIGRAEETLDIAMYNINDQTIVAAINEAYDDGVQIRYIAHGGNANTGIGSFDDNIPVLYREDDQGSGMHNKFVIIDADDPDKAILITGSTNFTTGNLVEDYNNVIIFQEQSLARGFEVEFEEMWGSTGAEPDEDNARFGPDKTFNTPVIYYAGDVLVEAYFSPSDNTTQAILETIESTETEFNFALLAFTRDDLGAGVVAVNDSFFSVAKGIIEQTSGTGNEFENLDDAGVEVYSHEGVSGDLHHKYCIADHGELDQDPLVLTGSHNWSSSAESFNDENTVIVHDQRVANLYYQEFTARFNDFSTNVEELEQNLAIYPNPANDYIKVLGQEEASVVRIYAADGKEVLSMKRLSPGESIDVSHLPHGYYQLVISVEDKQHSYPFIVR